jgi:hypothetical protein
MEGVPMSENSSNEIRDQLPSDLDVSAFVGPYQFPDNSRRRIPGYLYLGISAFSIALWLFNDQSSGLVNDGFLVFGIALAAFALFVLTSSWPMTVNERDALVRASQQVWRGVRSRPTWRVFCYSAQEPPTHRGLVLVDAVDGSIVECLVEANPDTAATSA